MRALIAVAIFVLVLVPAALVWGAQEAPNSKTHAQMLVASRNLPDPLFHDSVVLMLPIKEEGALLVGLIVNKPSKIKVRDVFPDSKTLQKDDTVAYFGGPVDAAVVARSAIFRSKMPPKDATLVFDDIYVTFDADTIVALAADPQKASALRIFLGRSQWAPEQFENEVAIGAWHSMPATADSVFSKSPEFLWRTLIESTEPRSVVQSVSLAHGLSSAMLGHAAN